MRRAALALGVPAEALRIDPRLDLPHSDFPCGVLLQVAGAHFGSGGVLLRGGRFDPLLGAHGLGERCACGLSINLARLLAAITAELTADSVMQKTPNAAAKALLEAFRWNRFEN